MSTINPVDFDVGVRVEETSYKGERWYSAKAYCQAWADIGYGRTPERAVGFALEKMAKLFLKGQLTLSQHPSNDGVTSEICDLEGKKI